MRARHAARLPVGECGQEARGSPNGALVQQVELIVGSTLDRAVDYVAERLHERYTDSIESHGRFDAAFAGGGTPRALYGLLATPLWRAKLDWSRIGVYLGDERHVPPGDPRSNFRMLCESVLDKVLVPQGNIHPVPTSGKLEEDASVYEHTLRVNLEDESGMPGFDFLLLGLGPDGHTASLFPGSSALAETEHAVVGVSPPHAPTDRVTITPGVINAAREVLVLTAGSLKAGALARLLAEEGTPEEIPARCIAPAVGEFTIVCDLAACEHLDRQALREGIVTRRL